MPLLFRLDIAGLIISTVIAVALALMVLEAGPRRALNRLFALFTMAEATWAVLSLFLKIALWLQIGNPALLLELATLAFALVGPLLFLFTVHYVSAPTVALPATRVGLTRWANLATILGLATVAALSASLFRHQIISNPHLDVSGTTAYDISAWGLGLASLPALYMVWSLVLFWQERRRAGGSYLVASVLILLIGFAVGGLLNPSFPIVSITTTFSIAVLGYGVVSRQLFNPLRELTEKLEHRVKERTQELAKAAAQLTAIHALGQKLALARNATEITRLVVDAAQRVLHVPICGLWIVDEKQKKVARWAHTAGSQALEVPPLPINGEQGIITVTVRSGKPVYLPDISQDPHYVSGGFQSRSELCVPLKMGNQVIGALNAESKELDAFGPSDRQLMEALANAAAIAIHNTRLHEETRKQAKRLTVVNHIANVIGVTLDLDDLMEMVYLEIVSAFHPDAFFIALYDKETDELDFCFEVDKGVRQPPARLPLGVGLTSLVIADKQPLLIRDVERDKDRLPPQVLSGTGKPAVSWLGVPMQIDERVIGVICVQAYRSHAWDKEDELLLSTIADQVAVALERAHLFKDAHTHAEELAALNELGQALTARLNVEQVLEEAYRGASHLLDTSNFVIGLYDPDKHQVAFLFDASESELDRQIPVISADQGLAGYIVRNRTSLLVEENLTDRLEEMGMELVGEPSVSFLGVPLIVGDRVLGAMTVQSFTTPHAYDEHDRDMLTAIASQTAIAIDNAQLYEQAQQEIAERKQAEEKAQRRAAQAALVYKVGQRVSGELELETLLPEIVTAVCDAFDYYNVLLMLLDEETQRLTFQSVAGGYADVFPKDLWVAIGEGMIGRAAATGETRTSGDVSQDPNYVRKVEEQTKSELVVPIKSGPKVIGVLDLQSNELNAFDATDVLLMETLADQIAATIENVRLYEEIQQRLQGQTMLFNASQRLASAPLRAEEIAEIGVYQLAWVMQATECSFSLLDPQDGTLTVLADFWVEDGVEHWEDAGKSYRLSSYPATARVIKTLELLVVQANDPNADPAELTYIQQNEAATLVIIPVVVKGQAIGVIELETWEEHHYTSEQLNIAMTLVNQAAVALENARLYDTVQQELTERKRAEEQLQQYANEMERANEQVKRFAYIVSHDLRAPLVNMKGFASELGMALDEIQSVADAVQSHLNEEQRQTLTYALEEDAREALEFINSSATRMDHFITALLKLSRLGHRELKLEPVDVDAIVQATLPTLAHQIAEHQVKVTVDALPEVIADQTSMEQVMGNILGNAVKYLSPDRSGEIEITSERTDDETIFHIRDNGRGIAEGDMDKVFTPFRRAGRQDVPGEGMGLAYVQALVRRHGGRIWCESELKVGTVITFTISNHLKEGDMDA